MEERNNSLPIMHILLYVILFYVATSLPYKCDKTISKKEKTGGRENSNMRSEKSWTHDCYGGLITCASEEWRHQIHEQVRGEGG